MTDPWAAAAAALFRGAGSLAASFTPAGGTTIPTRTIRSQAEAVSRFGDSRIVQADDLFWLPRVGLPTPRNGDGLSVVDAVTGLPRSFTLYGDPTLDAEGTRWLCPANPA